MNVYPKGVCVQGVHSHTCPTCHHFLVSWPVHAPKRKEQQTKAKKGKRKRKKEKKKKKKEITNTTRPQTCIQIPTNISSATLPFVSSVSSVSSSSSVSSFPCRVPLLAVAVCSQLLFFFWLQEALSTDEISLGFVFLPVFTAAQPYKTQTKQHKVQTLHRCLIEALLLLNVCVCAYVFVFVCVRACMLFDLLIFETSNLSFFPFLFRFLIPLLACFVLFCFTITSLRDVAFFESEAREWCRMCLL